MPGTSSDRRGSEWGLVFSVIKPYFIVFSVKLLFFGLRGHAFSPSVHIDYITTLPEPFFAVRSEL